MILRVDACPLHCFYVFLLFPRLAWNDATVGISNKKKPRDSQPTELLLRFMQGENNPHSIYLLQEVLREEGQKTFQIFLFAELCILCSVGHDSPGGSVFLDEKKLGPAPVSTRLNPMPASYQNLRSCSFKKE